MQTVLTLRNHPTGIVTTGGRSNQCSVTVLCSGIGRRKMISFGYDNEALSRKAQCDIKGDVRSMR